RARGIPQRPAAQAHRGRHAARDELRRTLLVEPTYRPRWLLPGVVVGADESPFAAAARAVRHELGPSVEPGRLLVVDRVPPGPGRIEGLLLVYDGAPLPSEEEIALPAELRSWAWCTGDELEARLSAHVLRRTRAARRARAEATTLYLENGSPIRRLLQPSRLRGAAVPQHAARRVDEAGREDPDVAQVRVVDRPPAELLDVAALVLAEVGPTQLGRGETAPEVPLVDRTRDARGIGDALATSPDARPRIVDDLPRLLEDLPHHRSVEALPGLDPASDGDPVVGDRVRRVERHFVAHPHQQDPAVRS